MSCRQGVATLESRICTGDFVFKGNVPYDWVRAIAGLFDVRKRSLRAKLYSLNSLAWQVVVDHAS